MKSKTILVSYKDGIITLPTGYKIVPIKPTETMLNNWPGSYSDKNRYKAFIEVAPKYELYLSS